MMQLCPIVVAWCCHVSVHGAVNERRLLVGMEELDYIGMTPPGERMKKAMTLIAALKCTK